MQNRVVHRDVAVRNIMVGAGNAFKLSDFGLARRYMPGQSSWLMDKPGRLAARYMSPENFKEQRYSQASDVWAFGIALWEMLSYAACIGCWRLTWGSYGELPYKAEVPKLEDVRQFVLDGRRMLPPKVCLPAMLHSSHTAAERHRGHVRVRARSGSANGRHGGLLGR